MSHTEALSFAEQCKAMDETMEAPLFGRRTAQQEYDAVSAMSSRLMQVARDRVDAQRAGLEAAFSLWCTAERLSTAQEAEVNSCLESQCTGDTLRMLVRACLNGNQTHAFAIASALRSDAASLYADMEL